MKLRPFALLLPLLLALLNACAAPAAAPGAASTAGEAAPAKPEIIRLDYAYYNPSSLVLRKFGWLEEELKKDNIQVEWVLSAGSNKANEFLRSEAVDFGSTAGAAALLAAANGSPIETVYIYSKPEWTALVVAKDSPIQSVAEIKGKKIAATKGTDPYFFLLRSLHENGLSAADVEIVNLQHADGRTALERGDVDAWAGLDPFMAQTELEQGSRLIYRNIDFNSYGFLNARSEFISTYPQYTELVLKQYERARQWILDNQEEAAQILADEAKLSLDVAKRELVDRTVLTESPVPGEAQQAALTAIIPIFTAENQVKEGVDVAAVLDKLFNPTFIEAVASKPEMKMEMEERFAQSAAKPAMRAPQWPQWREQPWRPFVLPLLLLIVWQAVIVVGIFERSQLPAPLDVLAAAREMINRQELHIHIGASLVRVLQGFAFGAAIALVLGLAVGLSREVESFVAPTLQAIRAVPSLAWVPLLILWMGIDEAPKVTLVAIGVFFPVYTNLVAGIRGIDRKLVEVGHAYGLHTLELVRHILLPAALPALSTGLRIGLAQGWLFLVAAELIAASRGLGFLLIDSQNTGRSDIIVLSIVLLALIGKASDWLLHRLERRLLRWQDAFKGN